MEDFWTWLARIADSLGTISVLVTLVISTVTYILVKREQRILLESTRQQPELIENFEETVVQNEGINSPKPVALIISVTLNKVSIKPNVETYLKVQGWKMPKKEIIMTGINTPSEIKQFTESLSKIKIQIQARKHTEVHLFINASLFACILTGSILSRYWLPTKIYHYVPASQKYYEYKTPLI